MKRLFGYALMLTLAAAPAFAAKNSQSLNLASPVKVGTTELPAGDVKVTWTGTGENVQVTIAQNGKTLTVPAKLVEEKHNHKGYIVSRAGRCRSAADHPVEQRDPAARQRNRFRPLRHLLLLTETRGQSKA